MAKRIHAKHLAMIVSVGILLALYSDVLKWLVMRWQRDADYSHGFLVPIFSLYLIWASRRKLSQHVEGGSVSRDFAVGVSLFVVAAVLRIVALLLKVRHWKRFR